MSIHYKLIIPLLDKNIKLEDISKESGFTGIYTCDINRPYIENCLFMLYRRTTDPQCIKTREKLSNLPNLYGKRNVKIKGLQYVLFYFTIDRTIRFIIKNAFEFISEEQKIQIYKFWQFKDAKINEYMVGCAYLNEELQTSYVPEEDVSLRDFVTYDEKRGILKLSTPL